MKITIHHDNGSQEVFQYITEAYLAYRQKEPVFKWGKLDEVVDTVVKTRSHSWGPDLRELVKEVTQSLTELQDFLREQRNANRS